MPEPLRTIDIEEVNVEVRAAEAMPPQFRILEVEDPDALKPIPPPSSRAKILRDHFFRRFFDNDTLALDGETHITVIRILSFFAVPQLMYTFWLLPHNINRPIREIMADRYFVVLFSFIAMGIIATFEWEMMFPDRSDFQILLPLPLKARELFVAKSSAVLRFLGIFLIGTNLFALLPFSALYSHSLASLIHTVGAHAAAVLLAGIFAALTPLAVEGVILTTLPARWFRPLSTVLQTAFIAAFVLFLLLWPLIGFHLQALLGGEVWFAKFIPPVWFMALYEFLMDGSVAPAACGSLAVIGLYATLIVAALCVITYPLGWAKQKKRAIEGVVTARAHATSMVSKLLRKTVLRRPQQRAVFHFITQTIARTPRYQVYFALYSGIGLAIALCCVLDLRHTADGALALMLSSIGLHALMPLLLFWLASGLRAAITFPVDMLARWIFPISMQFTRPADAYPAPYAYPGRAAKVARTFTTLCCGALTLVILGLLLALHWSWFSLLIQAICGASITLLLGDLFFLGRTQIAFTRPRLPGRASLTIIFVLYAAVFPLLILFTIDIERAAEQHPIYILRILLGVAATHIVLMLFDRAAQRGIVGGFPEDETDEWFLTLGLTR
ncbi:hypothetical protein ACFPT7_18380 [Acidicapsa dinghuensis]|uniref:ABC transporter permease n=1 Tax=Acidicapsa dinghuensis TaxID=2218256 RepID=A0ABW1EJW3_9BACT|nr:hypothetical protein [Acidicapsa dinghuensis]